MHNAARGGLKARIDAWRSSVQIPPSSRGGRSVACWAAKKGKQKAGDAAAAPPAPAAAPPGAPPPPPTVAPPAPKRTVPLPRQAYRRRRKAPEEYAAEKRAQEEAARAASQGVTLWLDSSDEILAARRDGSIPTSGGSSDAREGLKKLIIIDGYNFLNHSARYAADTKSGRLAAARAALHADLEVLAAAAGGERAALVVYDAMGCGARGARGAVEAERERRVSAAMERIAARFPPHSVPAGHRLRDMALRELGGAEGFGGGGSGFTDGDAGAMDRDGGELSWVGRGVAAVFSRGCEADTWILDELDAARARGGAARAAWRARWGGALEGVVVVSDDRRVRDGVLFAAMDSIEAAGGGGGGGGGGGSGGGGSKGRHAQQGGAAAAAAGGVGAAAGPGAAAAAAASGPSLAAWPCAWLDGQLDDARRRVAAGTGAGGVALAGGAAAAAAAAAWSRAALSSNTRGGGGSGGSSGASSDSEGEWADGDYDSDGGGGNDVTVTPPAPLSLGEVASLLDERGGALAAAEDELGALLNFDLGDELP